VIFVTVVSGFCVV